MALIVIVGPTAVGKSALAAELALRFDGEIVSADSRQIYRHMDVGTAKPTLEERALVPHHLIDVVDPDRPYTLTDFQHDAYRTIDDIHRRGSVPFLVGGTGLYVRAVVAGLRVPHFPPQPELRARLEARAREEGAEALHRELAAVDPEAARKIDLRNVRRVVRALEVYQATGRRISELQQAQPPPYRILTIGLTRDRADLYRRIDARVDAMVAAGLVDEVNRLAAMGYAFGLPSMSAIGYRQIGMHLRGEVTLERAMEMIKFDTHRYVRQQHAWFRLDDPAIHWFAGDGDVVERASEAVGDFLAGVIPV